MSGSYKARFLAWARRMQRDVVALYFAARDPETPVMLRLLAAAVAAYALSPIDLIPDFVPVLGYVDDLLIVPLGLALVVYWLPPPVLERSRAKAVSLLARPTSRWGAAIVIVLWLIAGGALTAWLWGATRD